MRVRVAEDGSSHQNPQRYYVFKHNGPLIRSASLVYLSSVGLAATVLCLMSQDVIKSNTAESVEDGEKGARLTFSIKVRIRIRLVGVTCEILCLGK